jgi:hypothetical protein
MFTGIIVAGAGTGKSGPPFSIGGYFYGIYPIVTLVFCLPVIGGRFPQTDDIAHGSPPVSSSVIVAAIRAWRKYNMAHRLKAIPTV